MWLQNNDAEAPQANSSEHPESEMAKEATKTKATPVDVKGTEYDKAFFFFLTLWLSLFCVSLLLMLISAFLLTEASTPLTESPTSRRPRFLTPNRSKRAAGSKCQERVSLYGVSSMKGAHDYLSPFYYSRQFGVLRNTPVCSFFAELSGKIKVQ